jgi:MFS family permease
MRHRKDVRKPVMSESRKWMLFGAMLLYAIIVSAFVAVSWPLATSSQSSDFDAAVGLLTFLYLLGSAVGFMLLVGILDNVTQRKQQAIAALSIGLAAAATYQAVVQVAFVRGYAYYKAAPAVDAGQPPSTPTSESR